MGVVIYNVAHSRLNANTLERRADKCPNPIGSKDGVGDIESMGRLHSRDIMAISHTADPATSRHPRAFAASSTGAQLMAFHACLS